MAKLINLYHGSNKIITNPTFGLGKKNNDFGLVFTVQNMKILQKNGLFHL